MCIECALAAYPVMSYQPKRDIQAALFGNLDADIEFAGQPGDIAGTIIKIRALKMTRLRETTQLRQLITAMRQSNCSWAP